MIWNYAVLGIAFVFEASSWTIALRTFLSDKHRSQSLWRAVRASKDVSVYTVLGEDTADLLGLMVVFLGHRWGSPIPDGLASLVIGAILIVVAIFLAGETKGLLLGERADTQVVNDIREIVSEDESVLRTNDPLTMHFGPQQILLNMEVGFLPELTTSQIAAAIERLENRIRSKNPNITRIFIEAKAFDSPGCRRGHRRKRAD